MDLKGQIRLLARPYLLESGFAQVTGYCFEKQLDGLCQGVCFVPGRGALTGRFTADFYLRYTNTPISNPASMHCHFRIDRLSSCSDSWSSVSDAAGFAWVQRVFLGPASDFFRAHDSISAVPRSHAESRYSEEVLFGPDAGWRRFYLGYCNLTVGNKDVAARHLLAVVDEHSEGAYDWIQERKRAALSTLAKLAE